MEINTANSPVCPISELFDMKAPVLLWDIKTGEITHNFKFEQAFGKIAFFSELMAMIESAKAEKLLHEVDQSIKNGDSFYLDLILADTNEKHLAWGSAVSANKVAIVFHLNHFIHLSDKQTNDVLALFNSIHAYIWHLDIDAKVTFVNKYAEAITPLASSINKSLIEVMPIWGDSNRREREINRALKSGIASHGALECCFEDEGEFWYKVDKIPTYDSSNSVTGVMLVMVDVTPDVLNKRALEESEERYRTFIDNSSDGVFRVDFYPPIEAQSPVAKQVEAIQQSGVLVESNSAMAQMNGCSDVLSILGSSFIGQFLANLTPILNQFVLASYRIKNEEVVQVINDRTFSLQMNLMGTIENGLLVRLWGTVRDITENKRHIESLEYQATHDSLTGLANRSYLYHSMEEEMKRLSGSNKFALILLDLDRFKEINDTLGHNVGDDLLKLISRRIELDVSDSNAVIARLGGDEFAVLLPKIRSNQQAVVMGYRILDAIQEPFALKDFNAEVSASIGITIYPDQANDVSTLMRYADVAMYKAKTERIGVSVYRASYDQYTPKRLAIMNDLGKAIRENQLELYYQPKINLFHNSVYGFEALIRWNHPESGLIPPDEFIPLAEVSNIIHPLTQWVVESSIIQAKLWVDAGYKLSVAANLSAQNLLDDRFAEKLEVMLKKHELPAQYLELEITESSIMADPERALMTLQEINELGVLLSIDDFGTGYSSLAYLKKLPVTYLKIDSSFVKDMLDDEQDKIIVHSTINLAHNLGLEVIAEGVEDEHILHLLQNLDCDKAQGYHIARPMPVKDVQKWLEREQWHS